MQVKLRFSLVLFLAACLFGFIANAQDEGQSGSELQELNQHPELNLNDDKTLLMDADVKASKNQSTSTHEIGAAVNSTKVKSDNASKSSSSEKTDEDPLSFNFLYFIIQKFKISDIVDD